MAVHAPADVSIEFTEHRLDNGLRVVLSEDHLVPVVAVNLWYDVGSKNEVPGRTGLAHLFEHMMFQGSRNAAKGLHFSLIEAAGGMLNATTSPVRTNYFEVVPSHALDLALWLEADRLGGLLDALGQETLDNQRDVVRNEKRQSYDNQPYGSWLEKMMAAVFPEGHPYHHWTIGSMADLEVATVDDVHAFFRTHYAPNNCVLSIVGDVEPWAALASVERYFGAIEPNPALPPAPDVALDEPIGTTREEVPDRIPLRRIYVGFRAPPAGTPGSDATQMAAVALAGAEGGSSRSSRIHRRLVREQRLAQDVAFGFWDLPGVSFCYGWLTLRADVGLTEVEAAFYETLSGIADEPPTEEEIARARAGIERAFLAQSFTRTYGRADLLSECATIFGDPGAANRILPRLLAVTPEEIATTAAEVLQAGNRASLVFLPEDGS